MCKKRIKSVIDGYGTIYVYTVRILTTFALEMVALIKFCALVLCARSFV